MSLIENKTELSTVSKEQLDFFVNVSTLTVFQVLNRKLNEVGLCISISSLNERTDDA